VNLKMKAREEVITASRYSDLSSLLWATKFLVNPTTCIQDGETLVSTSRTA
jgi:hypothetical protein